MSRHLDVLRAVAHEISPDPSREDLPDSAAQAGFESFLDELQEEAPRMGLGAATGAFVDRITATYYRYGERLFACFKDPRIPATTNELERFFGVSKSQLRHALGTASTAGGVAQNLGADYLIALAFARSHPTSHLLEKLEHASPVEYDAARESVASAERTATLRRSRRRSPQRHLDALLTRWGQTT